MSPASRSAAKAATPSPSWGFSESFVADDDTMRLARAASRQLGLSGASQGVTSALTLLATLLKARAVVEIGTGAGVSGLALLRGMVPEGILTSIDLENEHQVAARQVFAAEGVPNRRARLIAGAALSVLPKLSDGAYDMVVVDGDPLEFVEYVAQAQRLLRSGGVLVLNHALWKGHVADEANEDDETLIIREALEAVQEIEDFTATLLPIGDGLLVAVKA
ncbi:O-methyltransferase [Micropruina sonneratiae]|uniref:O-methyltransferase n=1 Tax=Micropruina sonneratiae TaxID=2986940 RepID=UPI002227E528|nr:class I SAM-dependent methyltransferase [Micropruina sp. KQZ13P-5]MCW3156751.1 class I SAM-dependent methyltransferase [Micropruina sp. KQZ13P-5]